MRLPAFGLTVSDCHRSRSRDVTAASHRRSRGCSLGRAQRHRMHSAWHSDASRRAQDLDHRVVKMAIARQGLRAKEVEWAAPEIADDAAGTPER